LCLCFFVVHPVLSRVRSPQSRRNEALSIRNDRVRPGNEALPARNDD
jgi:hypothetical protein